jgi:hypothetical protein
VYARSDATTPNRKDPDALLIPGAFSWDENRLDRTQRYDHPSSPDMAEAEAMLSAAKAAITASVKQL